MPPLVSVTLSAFNVGPYLRKSLNCIVNQTLQDIEIICTNDGSTDGTLAILQEFADRDNRIRVIDKKSNEGLAVARNEALDLATGKYIGFVDGDDLVDLDLFRKAYERAEETQCRLLFWDHAAFWGECEIEKQRIKKSLLRTILPTDKASLLKRPAFAWTKLIRTDVARSLGIVFPAGLTRQDIPVHWQLITQIDKIAILPERLSYYRQHASATTHRTDSSQLDIIRVYDIVKDFLIANQLFDQYQDEFRSAQTAMLCNLHDNAPPSRQPIIMSMVLERLDDDTWSYIDRTNEIPQRILDFYFAIRGSTLAKTRRKLRQHARDIYRSLRARISDKQY